MSAEKHRKTSFSFYFALRFHRRTDSTYENRLDTSRNHLYVMQKERAFLTVRKAPGLGMSKSYVQRAFRAAGLSNNQPPTASYAIAASNSDDSEASASAFTSIGKAARAPTATFPVSADGPAPAPLGSSQPVAQGAHSLRGKIPTTAPFDVRHVATVRTQAVSTGGARRAEYSPSTPPPVAVGGGPSSRELTPPLKSSEVSGPNQARRQLLSPVNPLRHTDVAIFCTSCWSSPLTRTRTGRIPRCKQSNHPMTGAVTVVRWRSSDRHIWVPVRPPPVGSKGSRLLGRGTCSGLFHVLLM